MFRKHNRRKQTGSLINFTDFVKFRAEKEKIITNPTEQNWKKTAVFQQLLELYKPQKANYTPKNTSYDKKDFNEYYRYKPKCDMDEQMWQNNEQYQIKKYFRMAEGMENWNDQFQDNHIGRMVKKMEGKKKEVEMENEKADGGKENCFGKERRGHRKYFSKDNLKNFSKLIDLSDRPRKTFNIQKKEIQILRKKAINDYGLNFKKEKTAALQQVEYQQYHLKEKAIFQKFTQTVRISRVSSVKQLPQTDPNPTIPSNLANLCKFSCPISPSRLRPGLSEQSTRHKKYIRIGV